MHRSDIAVIFDMDGTLTRPMLDFDRIRREIGLGPEPILESLETMAPPARARAEAILDRHEFDAAANSLLQPHARETLDHLRAAHVRLGLMTRNSRRSVDTVLRKHELAFDAIRSREDGGLKPAPDGLLAILAELRVRPENGWMVGDFKFDLLCGRNAGTQTVLFAAAATLPSFANLADHVIRDLADLPPLVLNNSSTSR